MSEITDSIKEAVKNRISNSIYGVFALSWMAFHWNFIFSLLFLSEENILSKIGILKNEYLIQRYFRISDPYFWVSWTGPFLVTYFIIWWLPKLILLKAYGKTEDYETDKKIIKLSQQRKIELERTRLQEQATKTTVAAAKQVVEEKKIKKVDPSVGWIQDYRNFLIGNYKNRYLQFIDSFYAGDRYLHQFSSSDIAYFDVLGLIEIQSNEIKSLTEKGKFFALKIKEEPIDF